MTFKVQGEIVANASQAKAAVGETRTAVQQLIDQTTGVERVNKSAASSASIFNAAMKDQAAAIDALRDKYQPAIEKSEEFIAVEKQVAAAVQSGMLAQKDADQLLDSARRGMTSNSTAIAATGNAASDASYKVKMLAYQLNQTAQMGAVTKDYYTALMVQLPDILALSGGMAGVLLGGALAVGATAIPALMQTADATAKAREEVDLLAEAMNRLEGASNASGRGLSSLRSEYGANAEVAREILELERDMAEMDARRSFGNVARDLGDAFGSTSYDSADDVLAALEARRQLQIEYANTVAEIEAITEDGDGYGADTAALNTRLVAIQAEIDALGDVRSKLDDLSEAFGVTADEAAALMVAASDLKTADGIDAQTTAARELLTVLNSVTDGENGTNESARELAMSLAEGLRNGLKLQALDLSLFGDGASTAAQAQMAEDMIRSYEEQRDLALAIKRTGEDSLTVLAMRRDAYREATAALIDEKGLTGEVADELQTAAMQAYDAENGISAAKLAAAELARWADQIGFSRAITDAITLDGKLGTLIGKAQRLMSAIGQARAGQISQEQQTTLLTTERDMMAAGASRPEIEGELAAQRVIMENGEAMEEFGFLGQIALNRLSEGARQTATENAKLTAEIGDMTTAQTENGRAAGRAATDLERERKAVTDLIASLQQDIAIMREADPVKQEMIRMSQEMAAATAAEREQISALLIQREEEGRAAELLKEKRDWLKDSGMEVIDALRSEGNALENVFMSLLDIMEEVILQAALLGEGPFANMFGTQQSGGLLGMLSEAMFPAVGSTGTVPTAATATSVKTLPKYATGGYHPGGSHIAHEEGVEMADSGPVTYLTAEITRRALLAPQPANLATQPQSLPPVVNFEFIDQSSQRHEVVQEETIDSRGQRQRRFIMSDAVGEGITVRGGKGARAMQSSYGLKRTGIART